MHVINKRCNSYVNKGLGSAVKRNINILRNHFNDYNYYVGGIGRDSAWSLTGQRGGDNSFQVEGGKDPLHPRVLLMRISLLF